MPKAKPLTKEYIRSAMNKTKSNRAAARYLNVEASKISALIQSPELLIASHLSSFYLCLQIWLN